MNRLCPICDNSLVHSIEIPMCPKCNLMMDPTPSDGTYGDEYLLHYKLYEQTDFSKVLMNERWLFMLSNLEGLPFSLLDYGCGANTFINSIKANCFDADIYSYDPFLHKDQSFLNYLKTYKTFDVVTFWDSFEHIRRLEIVPLLRGKHIFLTLPIIDNVKSIYRWKHYVPGEHVWYFSTSALIGLFEKWNYKLIAQSDFEEKLRSKGIRSFCFKHMED